MVIKMKKCFNYVLMFMAVMFSTALITGCSENDDPAVEEDGGLDLTQQAIIKNYVNTVVIPTYKSLADAAVLLAEDCEDLTSQAKVDKACTDWKAARKYWELSEAFLFGAASDYNIDPHIDSWPLDLGQLDDVLKAGDIAARIDAGTAGYGLLGFHAVEYVIFKDGATGNSSNRNRDYNTISSEEANFAAIVAADMRDQCIRLEAAWAGINNLTSAKKALLAEAELEPSLNYGDLLSSAGMEGNAKYKTQAAAFEEILVGASDISNEVGNTKISDPMDSHQWSDVESPHSWNSVPDFVDNLRSVRNAYYCSLDGTCSALSVSAHVAQLSKSTDEKVKACLADALSKVEAMPTPFRNYILENTDAASKAKIQAAVDACNALVDALDEAQEIVNK